MRQIIIERIALASVIAMMASAPMQAGMMGLTRPDGYVAVDGNEFVIRDGEAYFCGPFDRIPASLTIDGKDVPIVGLYARYYTPNHDDREGRWVPNYMMLDGYIANGSSVAKIGPNYQKLLFEKVDVDLYSDDEKGYKSSTTVQIYTLPELVRESQFLGFRATATFDVDPANPAYSSVDGVLYSKDKTTLWSVPPKMEGELRVDAATKEIAAKAASGSRISSLALPEGIRCVGDSAFLESKYLTTVNFPSSLRKIGVEAFSLTELTSFEIARPDGLEIGKRAFYDAALRSISIGDGSYSIAEEAFSFMRELETVSLGEGIKVFPAWMLSSGKVERFEVPASVTQIDGTAVGHWQFTVAPGSAGFEAADGFLYTKGQETLVKAPRGIVSYTAPQQTRTIGDYAFSGVESLREVDFSDAVVTIGDCAFRSCSSLGAIRLDDSVETVGYEAFSGCSSAVDLRLSENLKSIGAGAFDFIYGVNGPMELPESLEEIGDRAFYNMATDDELVLGSSLKRIGERAFYLLDTKTVRCNAPTPPECGYYALRCFDATLYVDPSSVDLYRSEYIWKSFDMINGNSGIEDIPAADTAIDAADEIFTLSGVKVSDGANLAPGIYIVRTGGKVTKKVIK